MSARDIPQVAALHAAALPDDPASLLGVGFLGSVLYPTLLAQSSCALVAAPEGAEEEVAGFVVVGTANPLTASLRAAPGRTASAVLRATARNPRLAVTSFDVALLLAQGPTSLPEIELQWIAVDERTRGGGVGTQLVTNVLARLASRGCAHLWVKTLEATPQNVVFYEKCGFVRIGEVRGRVFLQADLDSRA